MRGNTGRQHIPCQTSVPAPYFCPPLQRRSPSMSLLHVEREDVMRLSPGTLRLSIYKFNDPIPPKSTLGTFLSEMGPKNAAWLLLTSSARARVLGGRGNFP